MTFPSLCLSCVQHPHSSSADTHIISSSSEHPSGWGCGFLTIKSQNCEKWLLICGGKEGEMVPQKAGNSIDSRFFSLLWREIICALLLAMITYSEQTLMWSFPASYSLLHHPPSRLYPNCCFILIKEHAWGRNGGKPTLDYLREERVYCLRKHNPRAVRCAEPRGTDFISWFLPLCFPPVPLISACCHLPFLYRLVFSSSVCSI